ncbi:probable vacuolar protein sorting-associated protein 13B [Coccomyxa sp. Obi]|nr:probable vacuolar protein sorting-associated protein 13B [Coccomyxa sp. Obi]
MESLLTPLVGRLLSRFVKSAAGSDGSDLRASLQGGNVSLHNLELNLDSLLHKLPVAVERAFAMQLTVSIPWTRLNSQPIEISLDTVEIVLVGSADEHPREEDVDSAWTSSKAAELEGGNEPFLGGGWMGSLANLLMRTLLNVTVKVNNIVVKYAMPTVMATLTCDSLQVKTGDDLHLGGLQNPRNWLRKDVEITSVALFMEALAGASSSSASQQPLFGSAGAHVSAQFPVFAVLEKQVEEVYEGKVDIKIYSTAVAVNESQLSVLSAFVAALPKVPHHSKGSQAQQGQELSEDQGRSLSATFSPRKAVGRRGKERRRRAAEAIFRGDGGSATSGVSSAAAGAMGAVEALWSFIANDSAAENAQMPSEGPPVPKISKSDIRVVLQCTLTDGKVLLLHDSAEGRTAPGTGPSPSPRPPGVTAQATASPRTPLPQTPPSLSARSIASASPSFLEELEEAAASLPLSPSASLPRGGDPTPSPQQSGADAAASAFSTTHDQLISRAAFLSLNIVFLQVGLLVAKEQLALLDVRLRSCSAIRYLAGGTPLAVQDEVVGLYPVHGVESSALADSDGGSLALHLRWQPDRDPEAPVPHAASIHVGRVFAAYVPGLATDLLHFFEGLQPPQMEDQHSDMPAAAQTAGTARMRTDTEAEAGFLEAVPQDRAHVLAPPEWLTGGAVIGCSIMSLQLVALSAASLQAEAAALCVERCSVHLGTLRPTARAGSLAAELFAMQRQPLPEHGLRLTVVGARLGVAQHWQQAASRCGSEDGLADAGVRCVSDTIEVQAVMHAATPYSAAPSASASAGTALPRQGQAPGPGDQDAHAPSAASQLAMSTHPANAQPWVAAAAVSPLLVTLAGSDLAAVRAVAEGATAETSRRFRDPLPPRNSPSDEVEGACMPATLTLQTSRMQVQYAPTGAVHFMASGEAETDAHLLVLYCPSASAAFNLEEPDLQDLHKGGIGDGKGVSVRAMQLVLRAGLGFSVSVPACEVSVGTASSRAGGSQDAALFSPCGPPIVLVQDIRLERSSQPDRAADQDAGTLTLSIQSMSFSLALQQLTLLVAFVVSALQAPLLPALPTYPPAQLAGQKAHMGFRARLAILSGQLCTVDASLLQLSQLHGCASGFAVGLHEISLQLEATSSWASYVDAEVSCLSRSSSQLVQMQLGVIDVCTSCSSPESEVKLYWMLRCHSPINSQPAVAVTFRMKDDGGAADERSQDVAFNLHTVEARLTPAMRKEVEALLLAVLRCMPDRSASSQGEDMRPRFSRTQQPQRTTRFTVRSVALEAASDCMATHEQPSMYASDLPMEAVSAVGRAEDVSVLMHSAGQQRFQSWPLPTVPSMHVDVSMVSAGLTLFGPGLPFRGAPLLLPADIHMHLAQRGRSMALDTDAAFLFMQISTPALLALRMLADSLSREQATAGPHAMHAGACESDEDHHIEGQQSNVTDDLRCGLFEPADEPARPAQLQISCGDEAATSGVWGQAARSWVVWRFPYQRQVHHILVATPHEGLAGVSMQLSRIEDGSGAPVIVPLILGTWYGSLGAEAAPQVHWLLTVQGVAPAAEQWELSWQGQPTDGHWRTAASVLPKLYVNPVGAGLPEAPREPPLLLAPLKVTLCAGHVRLGVCLDESPATHAAASMLQDSSVLVDIRDFKVSIHRWLHAQAVQLWGSVQVSYLADSTLTHERLLEPICMGALVEVCNEPQLLSSRLIGSEMLEAGSVAFDTSSLDARAPPQHAGTYIRMRMGDGPVFLRLTELSMQQLRRITVCAAQSLLKLQAHSQHRTLAEQQNSQPSSSSAPTDATAQDHCAQQTVRNGALARVRDKACMLLKNCSPVDLCFGQLGTDEQIMLASGSSVGYNWHSAPGLHPNAKRLLHVTSRAAIASSGAQPGKQCESRGTNRAAIQQEGHTPADDSRADVHWSEAFEGMAESTAIVSVPVQNGVQALLSVQTRQVGSTWQILLKPSHVLVNKTAVPLQLCILNSPLLPAASVNDVIELEPQREQQTGLTHAVMVSYAVSGSKSVPSGAQTSLRVWLGRGNGWSLSVPLARLTSEVLPLQAAGLGADAPETPKGRHDKPSGGIFCQFGANDAATGLVHIVFWPPLCLHNGLSCCLFWRVLYEDEAEFVGSAADDEAILSPGAEIPLSVAMEGGERLAVCLTSSTDGHKGLTPSNEWSLPLLFSGLLKDNSFQGSENTQATLPRTGQFRTVEVGQEQRHRRLLLLAEPVIQGQPMVRLRLVPQAEMHNSTELSIILEVPEAPPVTVQACSHVVLGWQPMDQRPRCSVVLQSTMAFSELKDKENRSLRSAVLDLDDDMQRLVTLRSNDIGAAQLIRYVSVSMQTREHRGFSAAHSFHGPCESIYINVSPGIIISNLSLYTLYVMPSTAEADTQPLSIAAGSMQSLMCSWQGHQVDQHALLVSLSPSLRGCLEPQNNAPDEQHEADSHVGDQAAAPSFMDSFARFLEEAAGVDQKQQAAPALQEATVTTSHQWRLPLFQATGARTHAHLRDDYDLDCLLTCRVLSKGGGLHFVFFVDPQPPVAVSNNSHADVEVGISLPCMTSKGEVVFREPQCIMSIAAGASLHCPMAVSPHLPATTEDAEEEEAFLESVTGQQSSTNSAGHAPLLRVRRPGEEAWDASFILQPGSNVQEGSLWVAVWQQSATLHVRLDSCDTSQQAADGSSLAEQERVIAAKMKPLQLSVELECLQISVWDDERHRLLGFAPPGTGKSSKNQILHSAREAFCMSVDGLTLVLHKGVQSGAGGPSIMQTSAMLAARGMQCDSYLPGSSHPVICCSEPLSTQVSKSGASGDPQVLFDLQVLQAMDGCSNDRRSLLNTWVHSLKLRLPALALALDDAVLEFAERAAALVEPIRTRHAGNSPMAMPTALVANDTEALGDGSSTVGHNVQHPTRQAWQDEEACKAQIAIAPRLVIQQLDIGSLHFLIDIHVAGTSQRIPYPIDTHRAPLTLSKLSGRQLVFRPGVALQGLLAHYTAEALLSAPGLLGSLDLLLNPTGLLSSVSAGFADLLGLPLAALMAGSPAQFVASLGRGPASLLWHVSGWTLTSISGFSTAASHVLKRSLASRSPPRAASNATGGVTEKLQGLDEKGQRQGGGIMAGISRGVLGAVGIPLTGALDLVSGVTAGIASTTGVARRPSVRHSQRFAGKGDSFASPALYMHLLSRLPGLAEVGSYRLHCSAADATLLGEVDGDVLGALAVELPVLLLTDFALVVLAGQGLGVAAVLHLDGASMRLQHHQLQVRAISGHWSALRGESARGILLQLRLQASIADGLGLILCKMLQAQLHGAA